MSDTYKYMYVCVYMGDTTHVQPYMRNAYRLQVFCIPPAPFVTGGHGAQERRGEVKKDNPNMSHKRERSGGAEIAADGKSGTKQKYQQDAPISEVPTKQHMR